MNDTEIRMLWASNGHSTDEVESILILLGLKAVTEVAAVPLVQALIKSGSGEIERKRQRGGRIERVREERYKLQNGRRLEKQYDINVVTSSDIKVLPFPSTIRGFFSFFAWNRLSMVRQRDGVGLGHPAKSGISRPSHSEQNGPEYTPRI